MRWAIWITTIVVVISFVGGVAAAALVDHGGSLADSAVDSLSQEIGVAHVLGVLPDQMHQHLSQWHGLALAELS